LAFRSTTPEEGWEQALLDLPEGEGATSYLMARQAITRSDMGVKFGGAGDLEGGHIF
jgi:hypothetical protein